MDGLPPTRSWQPPELLRENVVALSAACVNGSLKLGQAQEYVLDWATLAWHPWTGLASLTWLFWAALDPFKFIALLSLTGWFSMDFVYFGILFICTRLASLTLAMFVLDWLVFLDLTILVWLV